MVVARFASAVVIVLGSFFSNSGAQTDNVEDVEVLDDIVDITGAWYENDARFPVTDRAINIQTGRTLRPHSLMLIFDHRVRESVSEEPFHNLLGFDAGGLKIGFGLRYGLRDRVDMGFYRLNGTVENFDTYEFDTRIQLLKQAEHHVDLAVRAGLSWFSSQDNEDAAAPFGQLLVSTYLTPRLRIGTGLLFHSDSSNDNKARSDDDESYALPGYLEYRLAPSLTWTIESVTNVGGYGEDNVVVATAFKMITHRHTFAVILSNSQYIAADGIVTNSHTKFSDAAIGFTILRELSL